MLRLVRRKRLLMSLALHADAQELITALKARLNDSERRVRALEAGGAKAPVGHTSMQVDDEQAEREREASRARERELEAQGESYLTMQFTTRLTPPSQSTNSNSSSRRRWPRRARSSRACHRAAVQLTLPRRKVQPRHKPTSAPCASCTKT